MKQPTFNFSKQCTPGSVDVHSELKLQLYPGTHLRVGGCSWVHGWQQQATDDDIHHPHQKTAFSSQHRIVSMNTPGWLWESFVSWIYVWACKKG